MIPAEVLAIAQAALDSRANPQGGAALWELTALQGTLLLAGQPSLRRDVSRAAFSEAHHAAVSALHAAGSGFPDGDAPTWGLWQPIPGEPRGLLHFERADPRRDAVVRAVLGLVREDEAWKLLFAGVVEGEPLADFARWEAATLGDFTFLPSQAALPSRDWLDVGYRRRYMSPRPPLLLPPDLAFTCGGTGSCCIDFEIVEGPFAQTFVDALPPEVLGPAERRLEVLADGNLRVKLAGERCRFLDDDTRCRIHARLGTPVFPSCVLFPFHFAETPAGIAVSASVHCPTIRQQEGPPVTERLDDLYGRLATAGMRRQPPVLLLAPGRPVTPEAYEAAAADITRALAWATPDPARRLWGALRALEANLAQQPCDWEAFATEPILPLTAREQPGILGGLGQLLGCITAAKPALGLPVPPTAFAAVADEAALARWLGLVHQARDLAYGLDLATATNALVLAYALALALAAAHGANEVPADVWTELGSIVSHQALARLLTSLTADDERTRHLLANPALGLAQLRALAGAALHA